MARIEAGQVAVITGGAAGIGRALADALAARGVRLALADSDAEALEKAKIELAGGGCEVLASSTDVADPAQMRGFRDAVVDRFGRADLIFANAGIYPGMQPVWTIDLAAWRRLFEINYWGVCHTMKEFVPLLIEQGKGHVVTTASMSGLSTVPGSADYGSAKHAVIALTETLRTDLELAGHAGIGVTILCPSVVMTEMGRRALGLFTEAGRDTIGSGPDLSAVIEPATLAQAALDGIEAARAYVLPTPASRDRFLKRVDPILKCFDAYPQSKGSL